MISKIFPVTTVLLLASCSSWNSMSSLNKSGVKKSSTPAEKYASTRNIMAPVNAIASSSNKCVDNFNFLRQANSGHYQKYSQDYIKIGNGYTFLNTNKNIMGEEAREVYTLRLDMKLDALCIKADYAGYQVIKNRMKELHTI